MNLFINIAIILCINKTGTVASPRGCVGGGGRSGFSRAGQSCLPYCRYRRPCDSPAGCQRQNGSHWGIRQSCQQVQQSICTLCMFSKSTYKLFEFGVIITLHINVFHKI